MDKAHIVEAALDERAYAELDRLSRHLDTPIDHLVATAILRFIDDELGAAEDGRLSGQPAFAPLQPELAPLDDAAKAMRAFLRKGIDDIEAGRVIPHEDVMRELRARYRGRSAA